MIYFKSKQDTDPSKLASAIAHNITNSDIEISCLGSQAVNATIKGLVIAKKYVQNEPFTLTFDFYSLEESNDKGEVLNVIKVVVSKVKKEGEF